MPAIGIDLGTTYSCVAVWQNGGVEIIPNEQGSRTTPSYVAFTPTQRLIGEEAKNQSTFNPFNTIFGTKRLIGRRYDDIGVQLDLRHWPFKVVNKNGKPIISVNYKGDKKQLTPEEVSAMLIYRMKEIAENYLGSKVDKAVITVPAYFNDAQRQATRTAAKIAGLEVLRITNEPTAVALAYGLDRQTNYDRNVLIYDLGGGTFDVSVLTISNSVYEVKSTAGNTRLGGEDYDNRLVAFFAEDFRKRFHTDISGNAKAMRRLKTAAERAKRSLTSYTEANVQVEAVFDGIDYHGKISRALFEELCSDLFRDTLKSVEKALNDAKMKRSDINNIILVGGSTRIPKIRSLLRDFFNGRELTTSLNPDESVASGAAIQAAVLNGQHDNKIQDLLLIDVVPLSLGVETARGMMFKVIDRNTPIPIKNTKEITTLNDNQTSMTIEIYEGERSLTQDNNLLGVIDLNGIPPAPRGVAKIDVTFDIDSNSILNVTAQDRSTGNAEQITIRNDHRLNQQQINQMIIDAEAFIDEDRESKRRLEVRNQLESYIYEVKRTITEKGQRLTDREKLVMKAECQKALEWLESNMECLREEFERQMTDLMRKWSSIMRKFYDKPWREAPKRQRSENYQELEENETATIEEVET